MKTRIESKMTVYKTLRGEMESLAKGENKGLTAFSSNRFGYEKEGGIMPHAFFGVEAAAWLIARWSESVFAPRDTAQLEILERFLGDQTTRYFNVAPALLQQGRGSAAQSAPLAELVASLSGRTERAVAFLCLLAAARKDMPPFPNGYVFKGEPEVIVRALSRVYYVINGWRTGSIPIPSDYVNAALEKLKTRDDVLWNYKHPTQAQLMACLYSVPEGVRFEILDEEPAPAPAGNKAVPAPEKGKPEQEAKPAKPEAKGSWFNSRPAETVAEPIDFDAALFTQPLEAAFKDFVGIDETLGALRKHVLGLAFTAAASRLDMTPPDDFPHIVFSGSSGVGKTTLAQAVARALKAHGGLDRKAAIGLVSCPDLTGIHVGNTEGKLREALNSHRGGVLILDEVDTLPDVYSYGKNAMNALNTDIGNMKNPPIVILTMYTSGLEQLYLGNKGLRRRFPNLFKLKPYTHETLMSIFKSGLARTGMIGSPEVLARCDAYLMQKRLKDGDAFAEAGEVTDLLGKIWKAVGNRVIAANPHLLNGGKALDLSSVKEEARLVRVEDVPTLERTWMRGLFQQTEAAASGEEAQRPAASKRVLPFPVKRPGGEA